MAQLTVRISVRLAALLGYAALAACAQLSTPPLQTSLPAPPPALPQAADAACAARGWEAAAAINASSLSQLQWQPFGRPETGWTPYAQLIAHEVGTGCAPDSPGFARALAAWETRRGLAGDGVVSETTFLQMKGELQGRRPILMMIHEGACPEPAETQGLAASLPEEQLDERVVQLRPAAFAAYRRMIAQARREVPAIAADPDLLKIFSGYRSPSFEAARCATEANCNGRERAICSPHRTGLAMDFYLGHAEGFAADSTADENRRAIVGGAAYRWLLANAGRFGFVNYPFEPWHWEWTGEAPRAPEAVAANGPAPGPTLSP